MVNHKRTNHSKDKKPLRAQRAAVKKQGNALKQKLAAKGLVLPSLEVRGIKKKKVMGDKKAKKLARRIAKKQLKAEVKSGEPKDSDAMML